MKLIEIGYQGCRQGLTDQLTLSQPGGADYAHHSTTSPPGFSDLATALHCICIILCRKSETSLDKSFMGDKRPGLSMKQCFRRMSTEYEMCDLIYYNLVSTINGLGLFTASRNNIRENC